MKDILIMLVKVLMVVICCVIQLIALVFAGIAWMFDKIAELLSTAAAGIMSKVAHQKDEEEISEEEEAPIVFV